MTAVEIPVPPIGRPTGWWGMLVVVLTEATLFALLLASYFYTRFRSPGAWPPDGQPDPRLLKPEWRGKARGHSVIFLIKPLIIGTYSLLRLPI